MIYPHSVGVPVSSERVGASLHLYHECRRFAEQRHEQGSKIGKYRITAARPKYADHHLNTEFKVFERQRKPDKTWMWQLIGWKSIYDVSALLGAGHEVLTGKVTKNGDKASMTAGAAVELELRIAKNDVKFRISDMPDS